MQTSFFFFFLKTWPKLHHTLCAHMNCEAHHDYTKTTGMLNAWNQSVAAGCMWIIETSQWHGVCRSKRHHWCRRWLKGKSSLEQTLTETWSPGYLVHEDVLPVCILFLHNLLTPQLKGTVHPKPTEICTNKYTQFINYLKHTVPQISLAYVSI